MAAPVTDYASFNTQLNRQVAIKKFRKGEPSSSDSGVSAVSCEID